MERLEAISDNGLARFEVEATNLRAMGAVLPGPGHALEQETTVAIIGEMHETGYFQPVPSGRGGVPYSADRRRVGEGESWQMDVILRDIAGIQGQRAPLHSGCSTSCIGQVPRDQWFALYAYVLSYASQSELIEQR